MKKALFLFLFLFSVSNLKSQTWQEYSDSIYKIMQSGDWQDAYNLIDKWPRWEKNILNIYGEYDYGAVKLNASLFSRYLSESLHPKSLQVEIANSNHHHEDNAKNLVDTVKKWLKLL